MSKRIKSILFVMCVVMVFTAQTNRPDDKKQQHAPAARPVVAVRPSPVVHNNQSRPVQARREIPQPAVVRRPTVQPHSEPIRQERQVPHVYAVITPAPVENNRLLHRQHQNHWQPRYNFYDNQYHFYPYVNIAATVELSSGGYGVGGPDGQNYYYDQGTFYLLEGTQYVAVAPPVGIIVNPLAAGARQIIINGQVFYRYKGVFYVQIAQGYQVIGPIESDSVES